MDNEKLRIIIDGAGAPEANMAADEALARSMQLRGGSPFARFYRWNPPSMSFGYFQPVERLVDIRAAEAAGIGVVRRKSGGKMVFHADEITFSIGMPLQLLRKGVAEKADFLACFQALMQPLVDALTVAGVPARFSEDHEVESGRSDRIHCYAAAAGHSIYAGGKKLIGAAGSVMGDVLVVHGSLPITRRELPSTVLTPAAQAREADSRQPLISVLTDFISSASIAELPDRIACTLASTFGLEPLASAYDDIERHEVQILSREKYSRIDWKTLPPETWESLLQNALLQRCEDCFTTKTPRHKER
ncbi:MAG: Octanoyltransferase LipM [bacterium ADurb.Bin374]|nr:MAG: Octanoyltransferase LipM [bacterium ADurb.Bin374]